MKKTTMITLGLLGALCLPCLAAETTEVQTHSIEASADAIPEGMILDPEEIAAWELEENRLVFPFLKTEYFGVDVLPNQDDIKHKMGIFCFKDGDELSAYDDAEFYYCVEAQQVVYTGLKVKKKKKFHSEKFRDACVRLMMGYNASYDQETKESTSNITRERAEELVDYCIDHEAACVVDDMRIRIYADAESKQYIFHMEY